MWSWLTSLFHRKVPAVRVPPLRRVYAIGDIHGYIDLLDALLLKIQEDATAYKRFEKVLVFLGDYIDRGSASKAVIERLCTLSLPDFHLVFLSGNHEDLMLTFLEDISSGPRWMRIGGRETLASYGVHVDDGEEDLSTAQQAFADAVPRHHRDFLRGLDLFHVEGDYFFVHAGIRPGRPLERQEEVDMLWIREPFLSSKRDHGKVVVHGHSIRFEPEFYPDDLQPRRIGIDTGAYRNGVLTCLALVAEERVLIQVGADNAPDVIPVPHPDPEAQ